MDFILVTGHQRSGTSVFRGAAGQYSHIHNFGEVFTPIKAKQGDKASFFTFANSRKKKTVAQGFYVTLQEAREAWEEYLEYLKGQTEASHIILDIKIDFAHNLNTASHLPTDIPYIYQYFIQKKLPILFFDRLDLAKQYASKQIALRSKTWHYTSVKESKADLEPFEVDLKKAEKDLKSVQSSNLLVRDWFAGRKTCHRLIYERLYTADNQISTDYSEILKKVTGIEDGELSLPFRKTPVNPVDIITNFADLERMALEISNKT